MLRRSILSCLLVAASGCGGATADASGAGGGSGAGGTGGASATTGGATLAGTTTSGTTTGGGGCTYDDPNRKYVARSIQQCSLIDYVCEAGWKLFGDACGCGCEKQICIGRCENGEPSPDAGRFDASSETTDVGDANLRCQGYPAADSGQTPGACDSRFDPACFRPDCVDGYDALVARRCENPDLFVETLEYDCNLILVHTFISECLFDSRTKALVGIREIAEATNACAGIAVPADCTLKRCQINCLRTWTVWDQPRCSMDAGNGGAIGD
jgi:hypothetical protein